MGKWEEMRFNILRDYYISAKRRLEWAVKLAAKAVREEGQ